MSYRFHLSRYNKELFEELRNLKLSDAELATKDEGEYFLPDMLVGTEELDDLYVGKYDILTQIGVPMFHDARVQEYFKHYRPYVLTEDDVLKIIDAMRKQILEYYQSIFNNPDLMKAEIADKIDTWEAKYTTPYNLNVNQQTLVSSFDNDYQIWDLIRFYKNINWQDDVVLLYGW